MDAASPVALAIHGGAGSVPAAENLDEAPYRAALAAIAGRAQAALLAGGSALDAVVAAVVELEGCPLFNAGHGAVLTSRGEAELDASLMDGASGRAAAVAAVRRLAHPVRVCRRLLENGRHVLLVGEGAEDFAREGGEALIDNAELVTAERREQLAQDRQREALSLDHDGSLGTVGAVARDAQGRLAAATSTGGMSNQWPGRVGDSAVIGAGTWADQQVAVSGTGHGERFIESAFAHRLAMEMALAGRALEVATAQAMAALERLGGRGGCIALGRTGAPVLRFNTAGMYRAACAGDGEVEIAVR